MRVIAGQWRGRRLRAPAGDAVRPTSDRVKEALFNILGPRLAGAEFVDLCCGAGGLGVEALSRGALKAVFVDQAPSSLAAARANLELCGADPASWTLARADAAAWLARWRPPQDRPWLVVADPPYRAGLTAAIMARIAELAEHPGFRGAAVEYGVKEGADGAAAPWRLRAYGGTGLALLAGPETDD